MDNLAHALTGALIARTLPAGWNGEPTADPALDPDAETTRPGRWVMWASVVAANLPDFEALVLWPPPLGDKAAYLLHHRGWSHSLVGIAAEAAAFAGVLWWLAARGASRGRSTPDPRPPSARASGCQTEPPVGGVFAGFTFSRGLTVTALGAGSHLFLDWWNGYGVRPFYPWDPSWYYGDLVFIVDPWVWLMLGGGLVCGTRRFGRAKWGWYALAAVGTAVVAGACWMEQCPWWVLAGWATGVVEIVLLRLWGRWRFAPLVAASLIGAYLGANARWTAEAVEGPAADPHLLEYPDHNRLDSVGAMPVAGVPWRRLVISEVTTIGDGGREGIINIRSELWDWLGGGYTGLAVDTRSRGRAEALNIADDPEVLAWQSFARFPFGEWGFGSVGPGPQGQHGEFIMGDARYRHAPGARGDWSELRVPVLWTGRPEEPAIPAGD